MLSREFQRVFPSSSFCASHILACVCLYTRHILASVCVRSIRLTFECLGSGSVSPETSILYLNPNERMFPGRSKTSPPLVAFCRIIWLVVSTFQDEAAFELQGSCPVSPEIPILYLNPYERCSPERSAASPPLVVVCRIIWLAVSTFQDEAAFELQGTCPVSPEIPIFYLNPYERCSLSFPKGLHLSLCLCYSSDLAPVVEVSIRLLKCQFVCWSVNPAVEVSMRTRSV